MSDGDRPTVLVEDEWEMVEIYERWLADRFDVRTAFDGETALASLDESVAVVPLDRTVPGISGDEVLSWINDLAIDCRVAIVSALDPDFDIVAAGFDAYVTNPVDEEELGRDRRAAAAPQRGRRSGRRVLRTRLPAGGPGGHPTDGATRGRRALRAALRAHRRTGGGPRRLLGEFTADEDFPS